MKKLLFILVGSMLIFAGCANNNTSENTTNNETTSVGGNQEGTSVVTAPQGSEPVELNTGVSIRLGDTIEMQNPNYFEGTSSYFGEVINMYPETGNVLFRTRTGIVELNYRYVIDIQGKESKGQYDGDPVTEPVNQKLKGVVYLDREGVEHVHFLRALDGEINEQSNLTITNMTEYLPLMFYDKSEVENPGDKKIPQKIIDFYNE